MYYSYIGKSAFVCNFVFIQKLKVRSKNQKRKMPVYNDDMEDREYIGGSKCWYQGED